MSLLIMPLMVILFWTLFVKFKDLTVKLSILLGFSILVPMCYLQEFKIFWPCGLYIVAMSTGLFVVFAYIVSQQTGLVVFNKLSVMEFVLLGSLTGCFMHLKNKLCYYSLQISCFSQDYAVTVNPVISCSLILLLLILVIMFMRMCYSTGGGFRKKF